jgi:hypothetical protein
MGNVKSIISKTTCDRKKNSFIFELRGPKYIRIQSFNKSIFIHDKVKLCRKSLMKMEFSIKWTCQ